MEEKKENIKDVIAKIKADLKEKMDSIEAEKTASNPSSILKQTPNEKIDLEKEVLSTNTITEEKSKDTPIIVDTDDVDEIETSKNETKQEVDIPKKRVRILPILLIMAALLALGYILKKRNDLKKEIESHKLLKKNDVDYKKKIIFKDIEDDVNEKDLQQFEEFKDIPDDTIK